MVGSTGSLQCDVIQLRTFCYTTHNKVDFLYFLFYKSEYKNRLRFWEKLWFLFVRMFVWMAICTHIVQLYTLCVQLYSLVCHAMVESRLAAVRWQYKPVLSSIEKLTSIWWKEENSWTLNRNICHDLKSMKIYILSPSWHTGKAPDLSTNIIFLKIKCFDKLLTELFPNLEIEIYCTMS